MLVVTVMLSPNAETIYNHVLLLPAVLWLWFDAKPVLVVTRLRRALFRLAVLLVGWPWAAGLALSLEALISGRERVYMSGAVMLPVLTALAVPLAILGLLGVALPGVVRGELRREVEAPVASCN